MKKSINFLIFQLVFDVLFIFQNFMKKYSIFFGLSAIFSVCLLWNFSSAEYELQIDANNNEVYLMSWDTQITLENADKYFSWSWDVNSESVNDSATSLDDSQVDTWSTINTWDVIGTGDINTWAVAWTWVEVWTWVDVNTWTIVLTWAEVGTLTGRVLWENVEVELLSWDEFDKALYWMYMNWLTMYNNSGDFRPYDNLTREEAAKIIGQLYSTLWFSKEDKWFNCNFVDTNLFNPTLAEHIYNVCRWWIFKWNSETQQYMPHNNLTKGQLLAVLMRIFEWKVSNESGQPRWIEYYVKALTLWMTTETNLAKFDQPVSRWEASLLIFRFKNMVLDDELYKIYLLRLDNLIWNSDSYQKQLEELRDQRWEMASQWWENTSQTIDTSNPDSNWITIGSGSVNTWSNVSLDIIAGNETLTNSPEFMEAINWMYDMWMTSYNTTESFMPYNTITRAQVAKMLDRFASATSMTEVRNSWTCEFSDVDTESEYKDVITRVCQYWIMAWAGDKFSPNQIVTKAEFVAMLIRLFDGKSLEDNSNPWRLPYYKRAIEIGLISAQDTVTFTSEIARYEVATYLYRLKVRLTMYNNLNSSQLSDEIVKTLDETQETNEEGKIMAKVYVDILALNNSAFTDGYVEILWERYRIKKIDTDSYNVWANSFVRYGTLYSIESWDAIGSISFILTNWALVEWTIRISKDSYYLAKDSNTTTYYNLTQR